MKYLVLLIGDGDMPAWDSQSPEEQAAAMQRFADFDAACEAREGVQMEFVQYTASIRTPSVAMRSRFGVVFTRDP